MSQIPVAEATRYSEQERGHWRFTDQGIRWTALGVILMAISVAVMFLLFSSALGIAQPRNGGAGRAVNSTSEILYLLGSIFSISCSILGLFAVMIGLVLCSFTPRPSIARYLALGALGMLIWSHASLGRSVMMQMNYSNQLYGNQMGQRAAMIPGGGAFEFYSMYFTGIAEYFLSIILGCCFLMAIAHEFHDRELVRNSQNYLKMLFAIPVIILVLGMVIVLVINFSTQSASWLPIASLALIGIAYCWMAYSMARLLLSAHRTIQSEIDPFYKPARLPGAPPPVIDPLAD